MIRQFVSAALAADLQILLFKQGRLDFSGAQLVAACLANESANDPAAIPILLQVA